MDIRSLHLHVSMDDSCTLIIFEGKSIFPLIFEAWFSFRKLSATDLCFVLCPYTAEL